MIPKPNPPRPWRHLLFFLLGLAVTCVMAALLGRLFAGVTWEGAPLTLWKRLVFGPILAFLTFLVGRYSVESYHGFLTDRAEALRLRRWYGRGPDQVR